MLHLAELLPEPPEKHGPPAVAPTETPHYSTNVSPPPSVT